MVVRWCWLRRWALAASGSDGQQSASCREGKGHQPVWTPSQSLLEGSCGALEPCAWCPHCPGRRACPSTAVSGLLAVPVDTCCLLTGRHAPGAPSVQSSQLPASARGQSGRREGEKGVPRVCTRLHRARTQGVQNLDRGVGGFGCSRRR